MQVLPAPNLRRYIRHYLFLECNYSSVNQLRVFADGNPAFVFSIGSPLYQDAEKKEPFPSAFAYGQLNRSRVIHAEGQISLVVVVFRPYGISSLLNVPARELLDQAIPLNDLGYSSPMLSKQVFDCNSPEAIIETLNMFFMSKAPKDESANLLVEDIVKYIEVNNGIFNLAQLQQHTGATQRQIERKLNEMVGLGPKHLGDIVKLSMFLKRLRSAHIGEKLTSLVYDSGYYDQAHLIKKFRKITGITPLQYKRTIQPLALNFISVGFVQFNHSALK
jgi:AraC-like DNA-binding protein